MGAIHHLVLKFPMCYARGVCYGPPCKIMASILNIIPAALGGQSLESLTLNPSTRRHAGTTRGSQASVWPTLFF